MRVLLHTLVFSPDNVSTAILLSQLAQTLAEKYHHEITVLTTTPHYGDDEAAEARQPLKKQFFGLYYTSQIQGIRVIHIPMRRKSEGGGRMRDYLLFHFWSLVLGVFLVGRQDVVITPSPPLTIGMIGWLFTKLKGGFQIYWVHELYPAYAVQAGMMREGSLFHKFFLWLEKFVYQKSRYVTVVTESFRHQVEKTGVDPAKVLTIPTFSMIEFDNHLSKDNPLTQQLGYSDKFVLTYAGNIGLAHSIDTLVEVIAALKDDPHIRFLVVGGGVRRAFLEEEIHSRTLQNVSLLPYRSVDDMPEVYAATDIGLVPLGVGVARMGLPSKVYSIMASGLPVLAAVDLDSDIARIVETADCGLVVPPDDPQAMVLAIQKLYTKRDQLDDYRANALRSIEMHYSRDAIAKVYHDLIESARQ